MRVADYIFRTLANYGIKNVFLVTGGGAMHLNDALNKEKRIQYICTHHEQAAAIAAEGYARANGGLAVVCVTSGPGGTNTLTGVIGQWLDSVPVLYLSGQVQFQTTIASVPGNRLRQLGDQEINIVDIVRPVTKYAKMIIDPQTIQVELNTAITTAISGRPGPVWLDLPLNVQSATIDQEVAPRLFKGYNALRPKPVPAATIRRVVRALRVAKRPILIAGHGIRIARAQREFLALVRTLNLPVVTTFNGFDLIPSTSNNFIGRIGTLGSRAGNFALQNADLVICVGSRNNIRQVSYNWSSFARNAKKIMVDIDEAELHKKTVQGDLLIPADAKMFLQGLIKQLPKGLKTDGAWLQWCLTRKKKYPVVLDEYKKGGKNTVHPYFFIQTLTQALGRDALVVAANGTACVVLFQAGVVKAGQRMFWNSGCAAMGYALPAAIGAACATRREVVCIEGDGSLQMNLQELQTIQHHKLPIKIFVLNNHGYRSIEQTQAAFFNCDYIGCNQESGVSFPDNARLAQVYGLKYFKISAAALTGRGIARVLAHPGAVLCEVVIGNKYVFAPKLSSAKKPDGSMESKPLEDLFPFLERDEFNANMIATCRNPQHGV